MSRTSKTRYAILGALSLEPMSGYDIKAVLDATVGHFWKESFGQLYPDLKRLSVEGLVSRRSEGEKGGRRRHVYSLTAEGRSELRRWLSAPAEPDIGRREGLLKLFFGGEVGAEVSAHHVEAYRQRGQAMLASLEKAEEEMSTNETQAHGFPYWLMTLRFGQALARAISGWAEETLAELEVLREGDGNRGGTGGRQ